MYVREAILARLGVSEPWILDVFAGPGEMWIKAYASTGRYLGIDEAEFDDSRMVIQCENSRFLRHVGADLARFDVFDLDAFASPWYQIAILARRLAPLGKRVAIVATDGGLFRDLRRFRPRADMCQWCGLDPDERPSLKEIQRRMVVRMAEEACAEIEGSVVAQDAGNVRALGWILRPRVVDPTASVE